MADRTEKEDEKAIDGKVEISTYIPSDIVIEILYKLPCKSLVRLMSTCKLWHSLAADRRAVTNPSHFLLSHRRIHLYSLDLDGFNHVRSFAPPPLGCGYGGMLPSSYGLTCGLYSDHGAKEKKMVVFNPITQQTVILTAMPPYDPQDYLMGFGFHPRTNQYKVIVLSRSAVQGGIICGHVLTLQSGRPIWRPISHSMSGDSEHRLLAAFASVCADGVLYWESTLRFLDHNFDILSFDLQTEKFQWVTSPRVPGYDRIGYPLLLNRLINLQEKLCSVKVFCLNPCRCEIKWMINIWMLVDSIRSDWMPLHRLYFGLEYHNDYHYDYIFPLCIRNGKAILKQGPKLYSYDIEEKSLRVLKGEHPTRGVWYGAICAHAETCTSFDLLI